MSEQLSPAVRIAGTPTGSGEFTVVSATDPNYSWVVTWQNARTHHCGCTAFSKAHTCRHVKAVFAAIEQEWQRRRAHEAQNRLGGREVVASQRRMIR